MADISEIKTFERKVAIHLPGPDKKDSGISVTLMSPRDPRLDSLGKQIAQRKLALQAKNKPDKYDDLKKDRQRILFTAATAWHWGVDADGDEALWLGEKPELTPKVFNEICEKQSWFMDQLDEAFGELESFFESAETI